MAESLIELIARAIWEAREDIAAAQNPGVPRWEYSPNEIEYASAKAALAAIEASGTHVVCPGIPDLGMLSEGGAVVAEISDFATDDAETARRVYREMLAARPRDV